MHRNAAGLAVGAAAHWVAVPWDRAVQHRQTALEQRHRTRTEVVSDMHGKTGRELLRAIRAGERAPQRLARQRARRCTHEQATLAKALEGHGRAAPRLALPQALEPYACMPPQVQA